MNFKKKVSSSWVDSHYIRGTSTDTITPPTTIYGDGTTATLSIKGNTVQNGTPTPANPVPVVGVGTLDGSDYKIPILNGSVTTNVYLGEVQTTRNVKKLVFDGTEGWFVMTESGTGKKRAGLALADCMPSSVAYSTHYQYIVGQAYPDIDYFSINSTSYLLIGVNTNVPDAAAFKTYLQQQYANGTPVTVWYVLSSATTGIVNEPLQKIGSYSDSLTTSIQTTDGANSLSVDTTVQPSEVSANYHGWHPVSSAHERSGGQWD